MRFGGRRTSSNVESGGSRGGFGLPMGGGGIRLGGGGLGCGGIVLLIVISLVFGINPMSLIEGGPSGVPHGQPAPGGETPEDICGADQVTRFSCQVLASTEDRWTELFAAAGQRYRPPTLRFYRGGDMSACGAAQSAMGPFYCPADRRIFLDTSFFEELAQRFEAPGDFAQAYVIAHEVGHHIQNLDGTNERVRAMQARAGRAEGNRLSVAMELQADCLAGVWAATEKSAWEPGDVEEGLRAASAIGDDRLQQQSQGYAVPESFTHGSSEQRMQWLQRGMRSGDPASCDTFGG
ncbi:KPN_02809 family neutral zinc metallopeptidase [Sphingosinicella rhizophila]|uniref:Neutral zinc metallopeptidase n=1 Tax=Sphingosinicella rhizophila TaxID=3050082 RepID=A0ABU3Q700_9SPHN|nr:neutral zinc metallopeptidase [Sphingosinicella sp. GR2756]MDT9599169.1 neutral zinc metallopeptidase [Sphingosinicella sp. GR2756]